MGIKFKNKFQLSIFLKNSYFIHFNIFLLLLDINATTRKSTLVPFSFICIDHYLIELILKLFSRNTSSRNSHPEIHFKSSLRRNSSPEIPFKKFLSRPSHPEISIKKCPPRNSLDEIPSRRFFSVCLR